MRQTMPMNPSRTPALSAASLLLALVFALPACTGNKDNVKKSEPLLKTGPFFHEAHLSKDQAILDANGGKRLECKSCHSVDDKFVVQRPGIDEHAPCDTCHEDAFYEAPGAVCKSCHTSVNALEKGKSPLHTYPSRERVAQLVSRFNHDAHLDGSKVKGDNGALRCTSCHQVEDDKAAYASFPAHADCVKCHGPSGLGDAVAPVMTECSGCHSADGPGRARRFTKNDIRFTHGKHQKDKEGKTIACTQCHGAIKKSSDASDIILPAMADCATCHEDSSRTPDGVRISNCGVCHKNAIDSKDLPGNHTASLPPDVGGSRRALAAIIRGERLTLADFTPEGEPLLADKDGVVPIEKGQINPNKKPEDHTPIFRSRHGEAASSSDAKCGYCHTGLSGTPVDNCNECHSLMRPKTHRLRWRGVEHGRVAAANAKPCATCHEVDFCTECHNIAPPNHSPLGAFRTRHDRIARFNPRSCMTCHTFEATCLDCHNETIRGNSQPLRPRRVR